MKIFADPGQLDLLNKNDTMVLSQFEAVICCSKTELDSLRKMAQAVSDQRPYAKLINELCSD